MNHGKSLLCIHLPKMNSTSQKGRILPQAQPQMQDLIQHDSGGHIRLEQPTPPPKNNLAGHYLHYLHPIYQSFTVVVSGSTVLLMSKEKTVKRGVKEG